MSVATVATRLLKRSRSLHDDVDVCIKDRRDQRHEVNLVFIGDSIGYRSYWAATCSLLAHGAREVLPRHDDALYQQVHRHRNFSALRQHIINQSLATHNSTVQLSNLEPLASQQFELDLEMGGDANGSSLSGGVGFGFTTRFAKARSIFLSLVDYVCERNRGLGQGLVTTP